MGKQQGFVALPITSWIMLGMGAIILILGIAVKFQTVRLESCRAESIAFRESVRVQGEAAEKKAKEQEKADKLKKEKADENLRKLRATNADLNRRLRDNASRSFVSPSSADTGKPQVACFNQPAIDAAIKRFAERVAGLAEQGQNAIDDLNNAKQWASDR